MQLLGESRKTFFQVFSICESKDIGIYITFWNKVTAIHFYTINFKSFLFQTLDTPTKKEGDSVNFFKHFSKDFLRLYGLAHDPSAYEDLTIKQRLNSYNGEFLLQPQICISEFAATLLENMDYLEENSDILDTESLLF